MGMIEIGVASKNNSDYINTNKISYDCRMAKTILVIAILHHHHLLIHY